MSEMAMSRQLSHSKGHTGRILHAHGPYIRHRYTSQLVQDNKEGYFALELHATRKDGETERVARVIFWDAYGDFFFENI
jgi:hypothetical protein